jgi:hypothetical protein
VVGAGLTGVLAVGVVAGAALLGWSFGMWDAALTWPPLLIGTVLIVAGHLWLGRAASCWIRAVRPVRADGARLAG